MALLFRINVISKRLTNSFTQPFFPPLPHPRRYLFTNSCSVYFSKKKVDEAKIPRCPDFEQYFTKTKKSEVKNNEMHLSKESDDKRKPIQPPIFGDNATPHPRTLTEKKSSATQPQKLNGGNPFHEMKSPPINEKKATMSQPSTGHTKPPISKLQTLDKKDSLTKSLNEFTQFSSPLRPLTSKNILTESPQKKENDTPRQSYAINDAKANGKSSETLMQSTSDDHKRKRNFNLLAATVAGLGAIGLILLMKKSSSDDTSQIITGTKIPIHVAENKENKGPLILPKKVPYLIIGGGTASWSAFKAIKDNVPNAKVLVVSNEMHPPYKRPPLSKDLWVSGTNNAENSQVDRIYFEQSDFYTDPMQLLNASNGGVSILNRAAKYLKLCERKVVLTDGTEIEYEECLLAIGSKPRNLVIFQTAPLRIRNKISFFRSLNDFKSIKDIVDQSESVAVIGGGFLASEISLALTTYAAGTKKLKVYQIFHENGNMGMTLPKYLSEWIKKKLTDYGLFVIPNTQVESVQYENAKLKLGLLSGQLVSVDHIIVALGSQPDFTFAQMSGLKLANRNCGIAVNENLEALPHLYVAGDAAGIPGQCGKETETNYDHAIASGQLAGENMAGRKKPYTHLSMFSSKLAPEISFESVGLIDSTLKTYGIFSNGSNLTRNINNANKGVVFYIKNDEVVGILLWNIFNKINIARQAIAEGKKLYDLNEVAKRFEIQE